MIDAAPQVIVLPGGQLVFGPDFKCLLRPGDPGVLIGYTNAPEQTPFGENPLRAVMLVFLQTENGRLLEFGTFRQPLLRFGLN